MDLRSSGHCETARPGERKKGNLEILFLIFFFFFRLQIPTLPAPPDFLFSTNEVNLAEVLTVVEQNAFCGVGVGELLGFVSEDDHHKW